MRMVMCSKLKKELEGLDRPTYPGKLGEKIYENINRLWKNEELEKNYIEIENNSFTYSFDITEKEFVILDSLFKSSMKEESNFSWNNYRIIKDLNYLFTIIPKSKSREFI